MGKLELSSTELMESRSVEIFQKINEMLKEKEFEFTSDVEKQLVRFRWADTSLAYKSIINVNNKAQRITWTVYMSFTVEIDSQSFQESLVATNRINNRLAYGAFSIDPEDGVSEFNYSQSFQSSSLDEELISTMTEIVMSTVSHFGEKLFFVSRGRLKPEEILD